VNHRPGQHSRWLGKVIFERFFSRQSMLFDYCPGQLQQFITNLYGQRPIISRIDVILHKFVNIDNKLRHFEFDEIPLISTQAPISRGGRLWRARGPP